MPQYIVRLGAHYRAQVSVKKTEKKAQQKTENGSSNGSVDLA